MKQPWIRLILLIFIVFVAGMIIERCVGILPTKKEPLYWIDPMEPQVHYPGPGKSRMGMELVPVYPEEAKEDKEQVSVTITPVVESNLGIRTSLVIEGPLARRINTVGYVEPSENKIVHVHTLVEGWIKNLVVKTTGEYVRKGQLLFQLYSPTLVNAQEEYLIALTGDNKRLTAASRKKLLALGVSLRQIERLNKTQQADQLVDIYSPQNGIVMSLNVRQGMRIMPETEVMSITDLSNVWIIVEVFEAQSGWVQVGQQADARFAAFPGKTWHGEVEYIYPNVNPATRTLKIRLRFGNPDTLLKPDMYADVSILASPKENTLSIPKEALIRTSQGDRVIVALGKGRFQVRPIVTGMESGESIEVISGLKKGENVVVSGQFLIDSEANLKASLERLETQEEKAHDQKHH